MKEVYIPVRIDIGNEDNDDDFFLLRSVFIMIKSFLSPGDVSR